METMKANEMVNPPETAGMDWKREQYIVGDKLPDLGTLTSVTHGYNGDGLWTETAFVWTQDKPIDQILADSHVNPDPAASDARLIPHDAQSQAAILNGRVRDQDRIIKALREKVVELEKSEASFRTLMDSEEESDDDGEGIDT